MDEASVIQSELPLVSCSELEVSVRRNLQPSVFTDIESIVVEGRYEGLLITLAQADYSFLLDVAFAFSSSKQTPINDPSLNAVLKQIATARQLKAATVVTVAPAPPPPKISEMTPQFESTANMSVKFVIDSIRLYLYDKESPMVILLLTKSSELIIGKIN